MNTKSEDIDWNKPRQCSCPKCGSTNIVVTGLMDWNSEHSCFECVNPFEDWGCNDCEQEFRAPVWVNKPEQNA